MSSGGAITPPQNNAAQMSPFGVNVSTSAQQQQLQTTLSHLFPSGMPFNFPHFDALGPTASANGAVGSSMRHIQFDGFPSHHNSRIKIKRCRQRVDAGEPRNAYQSQLKNGGSQRKDPISLNDLSQQLAVNFDTHSINSSHSPFRIRNGSTPSENDYADEADGVDSGENGALNCSFSASKSASSSTSSIVSSSAKRKSFCPRRQQANEDEDVSHSNNNNNCETSEEKLSEASDSTQNEDNSKNAPSLKLVINRRHNTVSNVTQNAEELENDEREKPEYSSEHDSDSDGEMLIAENCQVDENGEENAVHANTSDDVEFPVQTYSKGDEEVVSERSSPAESAASNLLTSLFLTNNNNNNADNNNAESEKCENNNGSDADRIQSILEAQRKMYSAIFMEQQRKSLSTGAAEAVEESSVTKGSGQLSGSSSLLFPQNATLSQEAKSAAPLGGIFGQRKPSGTEQLAHLFRFIEAMTMAQRQQQMIEMFQQQQKLRCHSQQQTQQQQSHLNPRVQHLLAMAATAAAAAAASGRNAPNQLASGSHPAFRFGAGDNSSIGNGIFPASGAMPSPFPNFIGSSLFPPSASLRDDCGPRRKRAKVTDSVRGPRSGLRADCVSANSPPTSERSSPLAAAAYFPPTMVAHPSLYGRAGGSRNDSPANASDELGSSDYFGGGIGALGVSINPLEGLNPQECTLNHVHLRKAKLMFFYTRYPSSAVLKTYFPDIQFNKNNTAQLVKWFSNFREFYYMQMEKYAKQAIAEGIRHCNDIIVTSESEIYKQLNQHYNRNNLLQPPPRLQYVIQETLKEFFVALQAGKDSEPSWKKVIYKIIQQYDDPIPEYFKDPNFIETLEQS